MHVGQWLVGEKYFKKSHQCYFAKVTDPNGHRKDHKLDPDADQAETLRCELIATLKRQGAPSVVTSRGAQSVSIYYATSPTTIPTASSSFTFSTAPGWTLFETTILAEAVKSETKAPNDGASGYMGMTSPADTVIDLSSIGNARYIAFVINSNYGSIAKAGFAEIQVTTAVPEPSTMMLLGLGVTALLAFAWRKRRK